MISENDKAVCDVCFRHCAIREGESGFCRVRSCRGGKVVYSAYGRITSLALDPIEKKPLNRFYPGSLILSAGSFGCNLNCPFYQNYQISWPEEAIRRGADSEEISPEELARTAAYYRKDGNIGLAFTYNEPLIGYEYILDTAEIVKSMGMKTVLVTNGTASLSVLEKLAPYVDAMNIDLKGFSDRYYREVLKGDRKMVMDFIAKAVRVCHVELTTLIVPGENDTEEEMDRLSRWVAALTDESGAVIGKDVPLHISRFFPRFRMKDRKPTDVGLIYRLADTARRNLTYVYTGNC